MMSSIVHLNSHLIDMFGNDARCLTLILTPIVGNEARCLTLILTPLIWLATMRDVSP